MAAAAPSRKNKRGSKRTTKAALKKAGSTAAGTTAAAAAAAAVAALRGSASSPTLLDNSGDADDFDLMSDLLLPDDPHLTDVLGQQHDTQPEAAAGASSAARAAHEQQQQYPAPNTAAAGEVEGGRMPAPTSAPSTGPAEPMAGIALTQQLQRDSELVPEVPTVVRGDSGALLLSSPAADSSSADCVAHIMGLQQLQPADAAAHDADAAVAAAAAAKQAGTTVDDLMAVEQILADLVEDGMLFQPYSHQYPNHHHQHAGLNFNPTPPSTHPQHPMSGGLTSSFSFQALLMSEEGTAGQQQPLLLQAAAAHPTQHTYGTAGDRLGVSTGGGDSYQAFDGTMQLQPLQGQGSYPQYHENLMVQLPTQGYSMGQQQQQGQGQLPQSVGMQLLGTAADGLPFSSRGGLSVSSMDYLSHQQRMMMLSQQEQQQAQAVARAEEKARRKEKKRMKKLQRQMQQQQQQQQQQQIQQYPMYHYQEQQPFVPPAFGSDPGMPPLHPTHALQLQSAHPEYPTHLQVPPLGGRATSSHAPEGPGPWKRTSAPHMDGLVLGTSSSNYTESLATPVLTSAVAADLATHGGPATQAALPVYPPYPYSPAAGAGFSGAQGLGQRGAGRGSVSGSGGRFSPYDPAGSRAAAVSSLARAASCDGHMPTAGGASGAAGVGGGRGSSTLGGCPTAAGVGYTPSAAAVSGRGMRQSASLPLLVLAGVPVKEQEAAARQYSLGPQGQQLDVLEGVPVGSVPPALGATAAAAAGSAAAVAAGGDAQHETRGEVQQQQGVDGTSLLNVLPAAEAAAAADAAGAAAAIPAVAAAAAQHTPDMATSTFDSQQAGLSNADADTHQDAAAPTAQQQQATAADGVQASAGTQPGGHGDATGFASPMVVSTHSSSGSTFCTSGVNTQHPSPTNMQIPWQQPLLPQQQQQQQQQVLDLTNHTQPYRQLSLSEATILAAGAAAAGRSLAAGPTMHHPSGAASLEQQQHQQGGVGQRRRGRGRGGQAAGGGGSPHDVNGGMDLAASSRLLRTSSGKVLRMLTHPVTGKPLLLGPAVGAKTSRLGNNSLGAPAPQLFGHVLQTSKVPQVTPAPLTQDNYTTQDLYPTHDTYAQPPHSGYDPQGQTAPQEWMMSYAQQQQQQQQAMMVGAYGGGLGVDLSHTPVFSQGLEYGAQYSGYGTVSTFNALGDYQQQCYGERSNALQGLIQQQQQELQGLLQQQQQQLQQGQPGVHVGEMGVGGGAGGGGWGGGGGHEMPVQMSQGDRGGVYVDDGLMGYEPQQG